MMQIVYAVMAIALVSLVAFGGVNYLHSEAPVRAVTSRGLIAQYETIVAGIGAYRASNNGVSPQSIDDFRGFLPSEGISDDEIPDGVASFGASNRAYQWSVVDNGAGVVVCLTITNNDPSGGGNLDPLQYEPAVVFAEDIARRGARSILVGETCESGLPLQSSVGPHASPTVFTIEEI